MTAPLPAGVGSHPLVPHPDARGTFTEIFRKEWGFGVEPLQWNVVSSDAGVLRGVHAHPRHDDYLVLVSGRATIGLCDLREASPTSGLRAMVEMEGKAPCGLVIPHGVAHGFLFHEPSVHIYGVTHYWDVEDELGCRWDDAALDLAWPDRPTRVSAHDEALPDLEFLVTQLRESGL